MNTALLRRGKRPRGVPGGKQRETGKRLCVELIQEVREIEGVSGVHVMAYRQEELVAEVIEEAGLLVQRQNFQMAVGSTESETDV